MRRRAAWKQLASAPMNLLRPLVSSLVISTCLAGCGDSGEAPNGSSTGDVDTVAGSSSGSSGEPGSSGEAPTTVEAPVEDVTRGVLNAVREIQELRGRQFLSDGSAAHPHGPDGPRIVRPEKDGIGTDLCDLRRIRATLERLASGLDVRGCRVEERLPDLPSARVAWQRGATAHQSPIGSWSAVRSKAGRQIASFRK